MAPNLPYLISFPASMIRYDSAGSCRRIASGRCSPTATPSLATGQTTSGTRVYFCSLFMLAIFKSLGVDACIRLHQIRKVDPSRVRWLGPNDYIDTWHKPQRATWMSRRLLDCVYSGYVRIAACIFSNSLSVNFAKCDLCLLSETTALVLIWAPPRLIKTSRTATCQEARCAVQ